MKTVTTLLLVAVAIFIWLVARARTQTQIPKVQTGSRMTNVFADLRSKYFTLTRTDVSIPTPPQPTEPWGAIMEIAYPNVTVTTVAFADGTASAFRSSGGGFFGGDSVPTVKAAGEAFLRQAQQIQPQTTLAGNFPGPSNGNVVFYLRTDQGTYTATAPEVDLATQKHSLSPLYFAGLRILHDFLEAKGHEQK